MFPTGVLAAALALAWRDPAVDPYPGEPLPGDAVGQLAAILDRDPKVVSKYLAELRANDLVTDDEDGRLRLGPAVATWPPRAVTALRRYHHLLSTARGGFR
jgi:DNA-binding IclR family transcriptional regulator